MDSIATVAKYAGVIGVALFVVGLLVKGLLSLNVFSKIDQTQTYRLLNNLVLGVFVLSGLGMLMWGFGKITDAVGNIGSKSPLAGMAIPGRDTSKYVLVFDEIEIDMTGDLSGADRVARLCFHARVGDEELSQPIDVPFKNHIRSTSPPEYRPIPLNVKTKTIIGSQSNEISVGMDATAERACSAHPDRRLSGSISFPHDRLRMEQTGNARQEVALSGSTWWHFNVVYHYEKVK